jgi:hypothetical protein
LQLASQYTQHAAPLDAPRQNFLRSFPC